MNVKKLIDRIGTEPYYNNLIIIVIFIIILILPDDKNYSVITASIFMKVTYCSLLTVYNNVRNSILSGYCIYHRITCCVPLICFNIVIINDYFYFMSDFGILSCWIGVIISIIITTVCSILQLWKNRKTKLKSL